MKSSWEKMKIELTKTEILIVRSNLRQQKAGFNMELRCSKERNEICKMYQSDNTFTQMNIERIESLINEYNSIIEKLDNAFEELENMIIDEDKINDLWDRCLKSNSYTNMGSEIRFDKIADMVIGKEHWHMRDQALTVVKAMGKLLSPGKKMEILKVSGVSKSDTDNCYKETKR